MALKLKYTIPIVLCLIIINLLFRFRGDDIAEVVLSNTGSEASLQLPPLNLSLNEQRFRELYQRDIFHQGEQTATPVKIEPVEPNVNNAPPTTAQHQFAQRALENINVQGILRVSGGQYRAVLVIDGRQDIYRSGQSVVEGIIVERIDLTRVILLHKESGIKREVELLNE